MKRLQASYCLHKVVPNLLFSKFLARFLLLFDGLKQVTSISNLHDDAEAAILRIKESIFVANDIWMIDTGQNTNFIKGVLLLFLRELAHLYFLKSVSIVVAYSLDLVDGAESTIAKFFFDKEVLHFL